MKSIVFSLLIVLSSFNLIIAQDETNPCVINNDFLIVVLGSSTAAGSGPSTPDSTWVNRYRKHLQSINSNNIVTNYAVGGWTTYHILPDWFIPPSGRALPQTANNVSQAVRDGADAIIVNMPSNDTSNGFSEADQMSNFRLIAAVADSASIPVFICTTQPKNFSNQSSIQTQLNVRDSILNVFGDKALDFWSEIATPEGTIKPSFDSGDGTHLNDAAHRLFYERVKKKNILTSTIDDLDFPDLSFANYEITNFDVCAKEGINLNYKIANLGTDISSDIIVRHYLENEFGVIEDFEDQLSAGINSCENLTASYTIASPNQGRYRVFSTIENTEDQNTNNNNSDDFEFEIIGTPQIEVTGDTICKDEVPILSAISNNSEEVSWYSDNAGTDLIYQGGQYDPGSLSETETYYVDATRVGGIRTDELMTELNHNNSWNGIMFDIGAKVELSLDSLALVVADPGANGVVAMYRDLTYKGAEGLASVWDTLGVDTVVTTTQNEMVVFNFNSITIPAGESIGIYLYMQNPDVRLSYRNSSEETVIGNDEIQITTGTGITHTFRDRYFPREWNGQLFYNYDLGSCTSDLTPVEAFVRELIVSLGQDLELKQNQAITLTLPDIYESYTWNGMQGDTSYRVEANVLGQGRHTLEVVVTDQFGCSATDKITIDVIFEDKDGDGFDASIDCDDENPDVNPDATEIPYTGIDEDCDPSTLDDDLDMDGYNLDEDCDDEDASINPDAEEIPNNGIDEDCDGSDSVIDEDGDGFNADEDCDDTNADINPGAEEIPNNDVDEDCDGIALVIDEDGDGFNSDEDCNDNDPAINPDAEEIANNFVDENCDNILLIIDEDGDGFNSDEDCNDDDASINPDADEIPNNGIDENCDGVDLVVDNDGDGFNSNEDCDDSNADINPDAEEIPNNDVDEDCDGIAFMIDEDGDGYNSDEDCDDTNAGINPGAEEIANNDTDEDCDGELLVIDDDGDGYNSDEDCNDSDPAINPDAEEIANNDVDEDCDGVVLVIDEDGDGFNSDEDCNDGDANINPGAEEIPNNDVDEDCDGMLLIIDEDGDGFNSDEDCDDTDASINPDAEEIANNDVDEDCDGELLVIDEDGDGFNSDEDCDDTNASINPSAEEIPNNDVDEDCDGELLIIDEDGDGFNSDEDCDDTDPLINPDAEEIPNNGVDEDCDGMDLVNSVIHLKLQNVQLYPNPSQGLINIIGLDKNMKLTIYNTLGSQLFQISNDNIIDMRTARNGVYLVRILDEKSGESLSKRIVIGK